ncbi:MAG: pullulanase-associated domain-containing protein, partial [Micrococcales bacterium]
MSLSLSLKRSLSALTSLALAVGLGATLGALPAQAAMPDELNLTVHYQRTDGDYTDWDVFLWKNMKSGSDGSAPNCTFKTLDEFGAVAVCPTVTGMKNYDDLGIIIRKGGSGWAGKDYSQDRFLGADFFDAAGKGEVWIKTEDPALYKSAPVVAPPTPTIVSAAIDDVAKITVTLNVPYQLSGTGDEGFVVSDGTSTYAVASVTGLNGTGLTNPAGKSSKVSLNLAKPIVLGKKYTVSKDTYGSAVAIEGNIYDSQSFADAFTYTGDDLGVTYSKTESKF